MVICIGRTPVITHEASYEIVRYALAILMFESLYSFIFCYVLVFPYGFYPLGCFAR
jgi:hypothetical protein